MPSPTRGEAPLSLAQQRMWFLARLDAGGHAYNAPFFARLKGPLDVDVLRRALAEVVRRHDALRTTFVEVEGRPVQRIAPELEVALPVEEVTAEAVRSRADDEARRPFDLEQGPLLRARLLRVSREEHVLLVVMHHIVCDGWSFGLMERELTALYRAFSTGESPALPELPVRYSDFAVWQRGWLTDEALAPSVSWWKQQLSGAPAALELPTDRPRPPVKSFRGAVLSVPLSAALSDEVRTLGRREGVTLFMTLLAGFHALLARYSGQSDIVVGSPSSGRSQQALEGLVGLFTTTLPLRVESSGAGTFRELLRRVRQVCLGAYAHPEAPLELLVDGAGAARDASRTPLFQVSFVLQGMPCAELQLPGVTAEEPAFEPGVAKFDLTLFMRDTAQGLVGLWEYDSALFDEETVARMAAHFARMLEAAVRRPELRLAELPLLSEEERHQLLVRWNDTRTEYPREACVHALFEEQVARTPDAVAVEYEGSRLTYTELNARAHQLARHLRKRGVVAGTRVGLCAGRSLELVVATLAILKAGGAYVPLDSAYPRERLAFMVEDSGIQVLLVQPALLSRLPPDLRVDIVPLAPVEASDSRESAEASGESQGAVLSYESTENLSGASLPADGLAYVMYTSGSTGRPKGVGIPHRSVVRLVKGSRFVELTEREVFLQLAPISFDASTLELWGALLNGAKLVLFPDRAPSLEELGRALVQHGVTTLWLTAALFEQMMASQPEALASVRQVLAGGDVLSPSAVRARLMQGRMLVNGYGPTENTTFTCCHPMTEPGQVGHTVSIGRPIANTQVYLLDEALEPVPVGVWGELYAGGDGLAWGYLGRPELTAERFVPHPFSQEPGARLYRTGDRARWLPDGCIELSGRLDGQVKLRGFRIELGEVESVLLRHPSVREAVVVAREDGPRGKQLVAYFVPRSDAPTVAELRAHMQTKLPEYMVPAVFVALPALPLTPNGKVDRKALPVPDLDESAGEHVPPRTMLEQLVAESWALVLGQSRVGAHDNFFERGGHSLLATQVVSRLRAVLGVELPVRALFEAPTVARLAERLQTLGEDARELRPPPLLPVPRTGTLPLSFGQQRLWFIEQLTPGAFTYNVPLFARLTGQLDVAVLERSLRAIVQRHEALRTTFDEMDGQPVQRIAPEPALALPVETLESLPEPERQQELRLRAQAEAQRPFDLRTGPLIRAKLLRLSVDEQVLLLVMHHSVCDGWSVGVALRELEAHYQAFARGEEPSLPALPVQAADHARWQREWLRDSALETQLTYWREQMAGAPPALELPTDRPRPPVQTSRGAMLRVLLPQEVTRALRELSQREGVTLFMALLAGFQVLLSRYSGQQDLVVGSPIAGRTQREVEGLIGFFVNTLALRVNASGDISFRELLRRVREVCLGAFAHQDLPFEKLVDALQPVRDLSRSPVFQVMFAQQNVPSSEVALPGVSLKLLDVDPGVASFDLTLFVRETEEGWLSFWEYNTDLFDEATVARMAAHYVRLLEGAVAEPEQRLHALPLLTEAERRQSLMGWSWSEAGAPAASCLHRLFEAQVERAPDAVAASSEKARLTYRELNVRANQLAHHLRRRGVRTGSFVGVMLERSLDALVSLLGVMKAGAAYLPLDPAYPRERLEYMLSDSGTRLLVTRAELLERVGALDVEMLDVEASRSDVAREAASNPGWEVPLESLAYLIYTSGSTGRPKAVMTPHRAVVAYALGSARIYGLTAEDRVLQFSSLSFDQSVEEIFPALLTGGTVVLRTEAMLDPATFCARCEQWGLTLLFLPTAFWGELTSALASGTVRLPHSVRLVATGGEKVPAAQVLQWRRAVPSRIRLTNEYGPTETTVICVVGDLGTLPEAELGWGIVPIGTSAPGVRAFVLDGHQQPVPMGVPGELYIGGITLAHGYLGRPDLTAERFVPDPFSAEPGARLYRTGDLVRCRTDGNLEYVGRADDQVKLRGFRVELGEVDSALRKCAGVRDVAVVVREPTPGDKRLVAYVVAEPGTEVRSSLLRTELKRALPEYMVPSAFVLMDVLPLTPSGKVDRKALPAPQEDVERDGYLAPRAGLEEVVANIWAPLLGVKRVGAHDNFFELGGHSLLATQVVSRLREVLQRELPVRMLFEAPTVAELARRLEASREDAGPPPPPLVPVSRDVEPPPSFAQQRLWFLARLDAGGYSYNVPFFLRLKGPLDVAALERALTDLVQRHEALRTTFVEVNGEPVQRISPRAELPFTVESLETGSDEAIRRRAEEEVRRPFDVERGPLVRATVLRASENEHVLLLLMHHIVCDFWSSDVLARELSALYSACSRGEEATLPALPVQYADFARWQRDWMRGDTLEAQRSWWKLQLAGAPPVLELPTDRPRPPAQTFRGAQFHQSLPTAIPGAVQALSREASVTPFMLLMAGFHALLARYSGQEDIVVGTPIAGRDRREVEDLIGFFTNTLALRVNTSGDVSFRELLRRVREACLGAYAHQDMPFEQLVDALVPMRDVSRTPLFQVMFVFQQGSAPWELPGMAVEEFAFEPGMAKFDLTLFVRETPSGWTSLWEYNTDLFDRETVARMAAHYARLLEGVLAHPERKLALLPLLTEAEQHQVLREWNDTALPYPTVPTVHALFEATASRTPDAIAASFGDSRLTYAELNRRANQLAHHLRALGVRPDERVGICVQRSLDLPIAVLATLKAGGAYVPLDPAYPPERLAAMLEASGARVLLTQRHLQDVLPPGSATRLVLDSDSDSFAHLPETNPPPSSGPSSLTYVIFTSGSTGVPKGVAMHHASLVNLIHFQCQSSSVPSGTTLQFSAFSFDVSFQEMLATWAGGGELVLISEDVRRDAHALLQLMDSRGVQRIFLPFVALQNLAEVSEQDSLVPRHLKEIITAGEQLRMTPALRLLMKRLPGAVLHNQYGPTETHLASLCVLSGDADSWPDLPLIGTPIANASIHLLDSHLQPVPVGVPGELYIGGLQVARGYWGRPDLTVERFLPDPFSTRPGARMYRTGDWARYRPDGAIEFLGRRDAQVKVRGFRIELGEIEAALARHPSVRDCVVAAREQGPGEKRLVAWVVATEGQTAETDALKVFLKERLPEYMVPSAWVHLDAFPLTPSGKVDRKALPTPDLSGPREDFVPPRTPMEQRVAAIWESLLNQSRVGARDNFFELGGHSLLATQVVSRLRQAFQVEVPVRTLFEAPTVAELAARMEPLVGAERALPIPSLVPVPRDVPPPLSFAQQRLWFIDRMEPGNPVYNIPLALRLEGVLDTLAMERAVHALVQRHESLRTTFRQDEHGSVQVIAPEAHVPPTVADLRGLPDDVREEETRRQVEEEARRPFDLTSGPLLRVLLLRLDDTVHVLVLNMHHIISDGWSLGVFLRELRELYAASVDGRAPSLPALPVQYADFAVWQRQWLRDDALEAQLTYWRAQLAGAPTSLELPTDRPRPPVQTFRGAVHPLHLPAPLAEGLRQLGQREGATLFMTLLAAWQALLSRYTGQEDLSVGSPIAGRNRQEVEGLIGFFVNTLVLRARVKPEASFRSLLRQVRETALGAFAHQEVPFERLVEALKPPRDVSRSPLFQVMFALQTTGAVELRLPGLTERLVDLDSRVARHDVSLVMWETASGLEGAFEYNTDLFDAATMARLAGHLRSVLEAVVTDAGQPVRTLPLLSETERHQLLVEWNGPRVEWPDAVCLHTRFEAHARSLPEALAVASPGRSLTYGALDARANQLAWLLRSRGVGPERAVALLMERSVDYIVGALGILKAGGIYMPLDPAYPADRLRQVVRDSGALAVVTQQSLAPAMQGVDVSTFCLDAEPTLDLQPTHAPRTEVLAENVAYLIYTSGSTGRPKGVAVTHRSADGLLRWYHDAYAVTHKDRTMVVAGLAFDITVLDVWAPLTAGGSAHLPSEDVRVEPRRLVQWIADEGITLGLVPTPMAEAVLDEAWPERPRLRAILAIGDRLHRRPGPQFPSVLVNAYGPTECTVMVTEGVVSSHAPDGVLPHIGKPFTNVRTYVLDGALRPVPAGVWGELYLGGPCVARGYLDRPDLTAERFLPDPFDTVPGARMYQTGDVVRWLADGNIEYAGRKDTQVKLRGFRIELGEIEAALLTFPAVKDAVVVAREDGPGGKHLVAYWVSAPGEPPDIDALRTFLRRTLPEHMVPSAFVRLDAIPLTSNGKPDRRALPAPQRSEPTGAFLPPREGLEQSLAALWADVLRLERVGANDNFFDVGGTSLLLQTLHMKVEALVGRRVPLLDLLRHATVRAQAASLASGGPPTAATPTAPTPATSASGDNRRENLRRMAQQRRGRSGS
ncbi:amino acid adenylation domain-containing protein [Pyxidicoccus parkwayensis]|uniref:Amino acid adenylation domain-containing protein n=1 Tax=Pyxidicoccus parkwayensis TaxID=2813578 RepID=A0ABX7P4M3_9BACT|nr:non-ribosomal peptide synthetase [Pyxidicoccus parkwaysis]QSQ25383.1 amino acid adenylation domain-containing protein [Pyxidicoccus parkwaysis]